MHKNEIGLFSRWLIGFCFQVGNCNSTVNLNHVTQLHCLKSCSLLLFKCRTSQNYPLKSLLNISHRDEKLRQFSRNDVNLFSAEKIKCYRKSITWYMYLLSLKNISTLKTLYGSTSKAAYLLRFVVCQPCVSRVLLQKEHKF